MEISAAFPAGSLKHNLILAFILFFLPVSATVNAKMARATEAQSSAPAILLTEEEKNWIMNHPEITVSNEFDWPPFDFVLSGKPEGFGIDMMNLLSQRSGIRFRYINGYTWDELVQMFYKGQIDLLHSLSITPERAKKAFFSDPYYHSKNVLILRKNVPTTNNLKELEGKIIALPKGWSSIQFFKKYYPAVHIIEVASSRQALEYVDQGKVFASIEQEGIAAYFIRKFGFTDLKLSSWIDNDELQKTSSMHFAVLKKNPTLFNILKKAQNTIQPDDMTKLKDKWFSRHGRQIGQESAGLTPREEEYLADRKTINVCLAPRRLPFSGLENGQATGMVSDFLEIFSEQLKTPFTIIPTASWTESLAGIKTGLCDIIPMVNITGKRSEYMDFTTPYLNYSVALFTRESSPWIQGLQDFANKHVGLEENDFLWEKAPKQFPKVSFVPFSDVEEELQKLSSGNLDSVLITLPVATYYIRKMGLDNIKVAGYSGFNDSIRIGVRKNDVLLHSIMSKLIRALPQKEIDSVYQKWVVMKFEHRFDYTILWKIAVATAPLVVLIIVWNRKLMKLNRKIAAQHRELVRKSEKLERLSITDQLTGLFNRRHINNVLAAEIERIDRYDRPLSIMILDIDHFKKVNDTYGHQTGDRVLCHFAETISKNIRKSDIAGRWGGEEFLLICPENDLDGVTTMAEHLRKIIAETHFPVDWKQTASFGVACYQQPESRDSFINRADRALYRAKENGRNRVEQA